jgi:hypothetical protein
MLSAFHYMQSFASSWVLPCDWREQMLLGIVWELEVERLFQLEFSLDSKIEGGGWRPFLV